MPIVILGLALALLRGPSLVAGEATLFPSLCEVNFATLSNSPRGSRQFLERHGFRPAQESAEGIHFNGGGLFNLTSYFSLLNHPTEGRSFRFEALASKVIATEERERVLGLGDPSVRLAITEGYSKREARAVQVSKGADMLSYVRGPNGRPVFRLREMKSFEIGHGKLASALKQLQISFGFLIARIPEAEIDRAEIVLPLPDASVLQALIDSGKLTPDPSGDPNLYLIEADHRFLEHRFGQRVEIKVHLVPFPE